MPLWRALESVGICPSRAFKVLGTGCSWGAPTRPAGSQHWAREIDAPDVPGRLRRLEPGTAGRAGVGPGRVRHGGGLGSRPSAPQAPGCISPPVLFNAHHHSGGNGRSLSLGSIRAAADKPDPRVNPRWPPCVRRPPFPGSLGAERKLQGQSLCPLSTSWCRLRPAQSGAASRSEVKMRPRALPSSPH